jgi:hypothetical protein
MKTCTYCGREIPDGATCCKQRRTSLGSAESMESSAQRQPLSFCVRTHARYIIPSWLFPVYLIGWGLVCQAVKPPFVGLWFFITVGLPFYGVGLWAHRARRHIPYLRFVFLTMVTPFLIFVVIALLLAFGQLILKGSKS